MSNTIPPEEEKRITQAAIEQCPNDNVTGSVKWKLGYEAGAISEYIHQQEKDRWIPISERLPELVNNNGQTSNLVLLHINRHECDNGEPYEIAYLGNEYWYGMHGDCLPCLISDRITHWKYITPPNI